MAKQKFYAVKKGKKPGIYETWEACKASVDGFSGAQYKSFASRKEAEAYLKEEGQSPQNAYGCVLLVPGGGIIRKNGGGSSPECVALRNVAGEMLGAMYAVKWAQKAGYGKLEICYDYMGIEMWATGGWKAKNELTQKYAAFMKESGKTCEITFRKIAAHTGDTYNEEADQLAKAALLPDKDEE